MEMDVNRLVEEYGNMISTIAHRMIQNKEIAREAAQEVCRQLRLRNISGIVIVDFINMKDPEHLKALMDVLREEAAKDSVQTTVVDRTSLHLVEMTRKKVHRSLAEQVRLRPV